MKILHLLLGMLFAFGMAFPEDYSTQSVHDGWLKITRSIQLINQPACAPLTGACHDTGAKLPDELGMGRAKTKVILTAQNIGPVQRDQIEISESLAHVPLGASLSFKPTPSANDGRIAAWAIGSLKPGESKSVAYEYSARAQIGELEGIPPAQVRSATPSAILASPSRADVGGKVQLSLRFEDGSPIPQAVVQVHFPDGSMQSVKTDSEGKASFVASKDGFYTYSVPGMKLAKLASTEAQQQEAPISAAAAVAQESQAAGQMFGLLPILAAIFAVAVIALIIYNFFSYRKEEGAKDAGEAAYSQKLPFSEYPQPEQKAKEDDTKRLLDLRRSQQNEQASHAAETSKAEGEASQEISSLEQKARAEGEVSVESGEEIESAIRQLEEIRQKLKEKKAQIESLEKELSGQKESKEPKEPAGKKKPQRVLPPSKKLKSKAKTFKRS
ncbi:MAG: hypothetical protein N3F07_03830 [Candidatus Micrarchaeota archaeon]|nr:hypothetical protein [Candidatus Micrarchaeota archaeon]